MRILEEFGVKPRSGEVGIEIEMEGRNLPQSCDGWIVTTDGSLRGEGLEYVFASPKKRKNVAEMLSTLQARFTNSGATLNPSDRCGVHVHLNCQKLTTEEVIKIIVLYLIFEELLVKWCGEDREGNMFCLRSSDAEAIIDALIQAKASGSLREAQRDSYRYASINLSSLSKFGSIEFRAMRTRADLTSVQTWTEMLLAIYDKALEYDNPRTIIENISMQGPSCFLADILGDKAEILACKNMDQIIMAGVRRVQDIVYADVIKAHREKLYEKLSKEKKISKTTASDASGALAGFTQQLHRVNANIIDAPVTPPTEELEHMARIRTQTEDRMPRSDDYATLAQFYTALERWANRNGRFKNIDTTIPAEHRGNRAIIECNNKLAALNTKWFKFEITAADYNRRWDEVTNRLFSQIHELSTPRTALTIEVPEQFRDDERIRNWLLDWSNHTDSYMNRDITQRTYERWYEDYNIAIRDRVRTLRLRNGG